MIKREAAYHEAGHALVAHFAKYHQLIFEIDLQQYGAGQASISLSKAKCSANGVPAEAASARLSDVARDAARIFVAGFVAEQIAAERDKALTPNLGCAEPDHQMAVQVLSAAGLSKKFDQLEHEARDLLVANWDAVDALATHLMQHETCDAGDAEQIIAAALAAQDGPVS